MAASCGSLPFASAQDSRADIPPHEDPGHNTHQESVIFACLGVIVVLAILCTLILWFVVERTKSDIRRLDKIIPTIAERMRKEAITANGELMSGTLTASHEFETEFLTHEEVQLTSYRERSDAEAPEEELGASAPPEPAAENEDNQQAENGAVPTIDNGVTADATNVDRRERRSERYERHSHERESHKRHARDQLPQENHSPERESHKRHARDQLPQENHSPERRSYDRRDHQSQDRYARFAPSSSSHDYVDIAFRQERASRSRPPPPKYEHAYDNPGMSLEDERDYRRARRGGPRTAAKPSQRPNSRPVSAYFPAENDYHVETGRPISVIGIVGDEYDRRPVIHGYGHGRRYRSLLYESHV